MRSTLGIVIVGTALGALGTRPPDPGAPDAEVDFIRDVLPILSGTCYECHGPDEATREADLRLDVPDGLGKELGPDLFVVRPGDPGRSELFWRISTDFENDRMPPTSSGKPALTAEEIATIRHWIEQGAEWRQHWAYVAPERPEPPEAVSVNGARHPIDAFVRARLEAKGLAPALEADRTTLIRRLSLDLTGLPPTVEEVDAFQADEAPDAYERLVDRLLASPHYGEKQARLWLDLARYADTHGYEKDERRVMWPYRDWVIDAFNADMPFDRFTIEQLAGDLLPDATTSQLVATGFHRNTMLNQEGGVDAEEFRAAAVVDRVNTTTSVWLGTTMGCAQCHSHKYDPFTQEEYYELYAFFDQTADDGSEEAPVIAAPTPEEEQRLEELAAAIAGLEDTLAGPLEDVDAEQLLWESEVARSLPPPTEWKLLRPTAWSSEAGATLGLLNDGSLLALGADPETDAYEVVARPGPGRIDALRVEALRHETLPQGGPGRASNGNFVLTDVELRIRRGAINDGRRFAVAEANFTQIGREFPAPRAIDAGADTGWAVDGYQDRDDLAAVFVLDEPLQLEEEDELVVVLRFDYHSPHVLGRLRLSVAADERLLADMTPPPMGVWQVVGPFEAPSGEEAFDTVWPPEADFTSGEPVAPVYANGLSWETRPDWEDGRVHPLSGESSAFYLMRTIQSPTARRLLFSLGSDDSIRVWLNGELVHSNEVVRAAAPDQDSVVVDLPAGPSMVLIKIVNHGGPAGFCFDARTRTGEEMPPDVVAALRLPAEECDEDQRDAVRAYYRRYASPRGRELFERIEALEDERRAVDASVARTMVMQRTEEPRQTHVHVRGNFLALGEPVEP
ncbi:MAG: DUF1549 domain-containing protein, partial [Planctomycetota bacterium]|nr:DUF1549 domain-containing protein [Planctomycetota bacterium]